MAPLSTLALLWFGWLVSWLLASRWSATTVARQSSGARVVQSLPIWVGGILLTRSPGPMLPMPVNTLRLVQWGAVVVAALGFGFAWWARIHLGRFWSAAVTLKKEHALIRSGPYALTRHPIYSGLLLAALATAVARGSLSALFGVGFILGGLAMKLRQEEEFMHGQFGEVYGAYKKAVPALIPRPW